MSTKKFKSIIVASESPDLYTSKRLLTEAKRLKLSSAWINPYQSMLGPGDLRLETTPKSSLYFHRTTGIRYDDFDLMVSEHHQQIGHTLTNPLLALQLFRDKDRQVNFFSKHQIPQIKSISYRGDLKEIYWNSIIDLAPLDQNFIIKMSRGNQGIGVNLVTGLASLRSFLETFHAMKDQRFIIQPFIAHKKQWRVFIIKQEIVGIVERTLAKDDFRGNSKRSTGKMIKKISREIEDQLLRGVALSGLDYCGVDIIADSNQFYFLEFNSVPGFEQLEELSGQNIARELITKI